MDPLLIAGVALLAVAALGLGIAGWRMLSEDRAATDRLARLTATQRGAPPPEFRRSTAPAGAVDVLAERAARLAVSDDEQLAALRRRLLQAGFRGRTAAERYSAARALGALALGLLAVLAAPKDDPVTLGGAALLATALGYYAPAAWVAQRLAERQRALLLAFPDALDLLVSSVEAGLGVDAALKRVGEELGEAAPELSRELALVTLETNAGVTRTEALRHLAERTGMDDVASLVHVLVQAERYGTSVAHALRTHAELVRKRRMQRAEETAQKASPRMTVLMILFVLPALLVILVGPAAINIKNTLGPALSGGTP
jgi:tight adherence protein C